MFAVAAQKRSAPSRLLPVLEFIGGGLAAAREPEGGHMASDSNTAAPAVNSDAEAKGLQAEAEKAKYLETIAKSQQGAAEAKAASLKSLLPSVTGAPKGEVTLGDKAGAFGPWRAHEMIDAVAKEIAAKVKDALPEEAARVLVVNDRALLESDWTARQVHGTLDRLNRRIAALKTVVVAGKETLRRGVDEYTQAEARQGATTADQSAQRRGAGATVSAGAPAGALPAGVPGALGAAVDLLGLIRTDYTVTASTVTPGPAELITLTAAHLAAKEVSVEADVFATVGTSPSLRKFTGLLDARDAVVETLSGLTQTLAPVEAELAAIAGRIAIVEPQWAQAVADGKEDAAVQALRQAVDTISWQASRREAVAGPARVLVTYAQQVVADVDAAAAALVQAPAGGQAPLFTAAQRERLETGDNVEARITHVLYVSLDAVAADTVTRRSILGASGIVRFLTATNASWLLLDTATGTVAGGSQESNADIMTFSLETGDATYGGKPEALNASSVLKDPMRTLEGPARFLIIVLACVLVVFGLLSILAVIRVVVG